MQYTTFQTKSQLFSEKKDEKKVAKIVLSALSRNPRFTNLLPLYYTKETSSGAFQLEAPGQKVEEFCPLHLPVDLIDDKRVTKQNAGGRQDPQDRYAALAQEMHEAQIQLNTLIDASEDHLSRRPILFCQNDDGSGIFFRGMVRGDPEYSKRMGIRLNQATEEMAKIPGTALFITLTYAVNQHDRDMFEAQTIHQKMTDNFLRHCRRFGKCSYVSVLEQTAKGYPHVHLLIKWHERQFKARRNSRGEYVLQNRKFYKLLKSWQEMPQFKVLVVKDSAVATYITKYVCKGLVSERKSLKVLSDKEIAELRKSMLCYILGYMAHARQFRISQDLQKKKVDAPNNSVLADDEFLDLLDDTEFLTEAMENVLISLLNKLTNICKAHVWAIYNEREKEKFDLADGFYEEIPGEIIRIFKEKGYPRGCPGCIVTRFLENLPKKDNLLKVKARKIYPNLDRLVSEAIGG